MSADFDKAIDGAVREMMDVEPRADLRARVVASAFGRNDAGDRAQRSARVVSGFSRNRWTFAAAAAAIVLAVFVARRSEPVAPAPIVARGVDVRLPSTVVAQAAPHEVAPVAAPRVTAGRGVTHPAERVVVAASYADEDAGAVIAPLNPITPISVAPIPQDRIASAEIAVRPLNPISDVQIAPLTPPDRRN